MEVVRVEEVVEHADGAASIRVVEINELHERRLIGLVRVVDSVAGRAAARLKLDDMLLIPEPVVVPEFLDGVGLGEFQDVGRADRQGERAERRRERAERRRERENRRAREGRV